MMVVLTDTLSRDDSVEDSMETQQSSASNSGPEIKDGRSE